MNQNETKQMLKYMSLNMVKSEPLLTRMDQPLAMVTTVLASNAVFKMSMT
ncbi:hypothetical protein JCM19233_452 [Vibrio astriarenae]|nr:hypothetical protein JCM19233_452 [Vibrio sp. C7]